MFGSLILGQSDEIALGLIEEKRNVVRVSFYRDSRMLAVVTDDGEETFMTSEIDPALAVPMQKSNIIHISHLNADQSLDREYSVALTIA